MRDTKSWNVKASIYATNTFNPIRDIIENLKINPNPDKPMIALSIGDPTVFGNLKPAKEITEAVVEAIAKGKYNGYAPSTGYEEARSAVAEYCSTPQAFVESKDVILCSGCSCALDLCIMALCSPGQNILVPRPGFPLYITLAKGLGISTKFYDLVPESNWEVDLTMMENAIDENTAAIVINNPSNPCGSVFSRDHLKAILAVAERNKIPIIADEIYDNFVFSGQEFSWMSSLSRNVPILSCGGLTKRFLIPGWRMGWIVIHDRNDIFSQEVRQGLQKLSQRIIGSNTLIQGALPSILKNTPQSFFTDTLKAVEGNAKLSYGMLSQAKGLNPIMPQGAMYMMVGIDMDHFPDFDTDLQLVEKMISEESVFCLPGKCFSLPNYFRVVLTVPEEQMKEACLRIQEFCCRHYKSSSVLFGVTVGNGGVYVNGLNHVNDGIVNGNVEKFLDEDVIPDELLDFRTRGIPSKIDLPDIPDMVKQSPVFIQRDFIAAEMDGE